MLTNNWIDAIKVVGIVTSDIYETSILTLFMTFTCLASMSIQVIVTEVQKYYPSVQNVVHDSVMKWKQSFHLILNFIEGVDHIFGPALLILMSKLLITIAVYSYSIIVSLSHNHPVNLAVVYLIKYLFLILILTIGTLQMKIKVSLLHTVPSQSS